MKKKIVFAMLGTLAIVSLTACGTAQSTAGDQGSVIASEEANEQQAAAEEPESEEAEGLAIPDTIPDPVTYEGNGDSVIEIEPPEGVWVIYAKGNSDARHFAVTGFDENSEQTDLFVNTTDPYEGITLDPSQTTRTLEVKATGDWKIEIRSVWSCDIINDLTTHSGTNDSIVLINTPAKSAQIEGNSESRHFAVKSYGEGSDLLVNTTDPYSGTVMLNKNTVMLEVSATGEWSITLQ